MADATIQPSENANDYRKKVGILLDALEEVTNIDVEYIALGAGVSLPVDAFNDITNAEFTTSVGTVQSLLTYLDGPGIYTNLYRLSDGGHR
jgi:hypothetical protein